jgi:hypothetical protein
MTAEQINNQYSAMYPIHETPAVTIPAQKGLALSLLDWHGGQSSAVYAVGSCMLSDSNGGKTYDPANHRGHADGETETGAVRRACLELRGLRKNANFPEAVTKKGEAECNALADKLTGLYLV